MQAIHTQYIAPTNTRGARISATAQAGRVVVAWDYELNVEANHRAAADALRAKFGWTESTHGKMVTGWLPKDKGLCHVMVGRG